MHILKKSLGLFGSLIFGHKAKALPAPAPGPVSRDDAASAVAASDMMARRQGSAADLLNGTRGAEALGGSTGKLVLGN